MFVVFDYIGECIMLLFNELFVLSEIGEGVFVCFIFMCELKGV